MKLKSLLLASASLLAITAHAQKKKIDHTVYDQWKTIRGAQISDNGSVVTYEVNPQSGDGNLYVYEVESKRTDTIRRGYSAQFVDGGTHIIFRIKPEFELTRKAKLAKKKEDDMPKDSLGVYDVKEHKIIARFPMIKSQEGKEESSWIIVHHTKMKEAAPVGKKKKKKKKEPEIKSDGTKLELVSLKQYHQPPADPKKKKKKESGPLFNYSFPYVTEYAYSKKGNQIAFIMQKNVDKADSAYLYVFSTSDEKLKSIHALNGFMKSLSFDESGNQIAYLASSDTSKNKVYDLWYWNSNNSSCSKMVDSATTAMPKGQCVSENSSLWFSADGKKLFFGTAPKPEKEIKDTLTDDEKYRLDIWSWTDTRLMPEQLKMLDRDKKKNYLAVYHLDKNKMVQIADTKMDGVRTILKGNGDIALGISDVNYEKSKSWDSPVPADYYLVDLNSGERKLLLGDQKFYCSLSASGNYLLYYRRKEDQWYALEIASGKTINLTEKITDDFFEDDNGNPSEEDVIGCMGWAEKDAYVYLYGEHDIWKIDPKDPSKPICLTRNFGRESKTILRYEKLDDEEQFIREEFLVLRSFNKENRRAGFYLYEASNKANAPVRMAESDHKYNYLIKSKKSNKTVFARMSFVEYADVWISDVRFNNAEKISDANPQQKEYNWGTVKMTHWKSPKGRELDGLIYYPEDFDSTKKYPMLVYFYEKYADDIHNYYAPRPSASIINPTEYASNGYIVFIPDILYNEGTPGEDAYDCIVSGTDHVAKNKYINTERMGLQGQSWGGYQTAYLVTQTNKYRAAMAGAPVSNMTSAYGGIRWGSGWSRAFQYEKGQSRLGYTLWEDRERYIKNSPLFHADKVNTPLLIMHNDKDGAVPWYQGIEYFSALRRLNKPVWMLNYNDDDHNLTRRANQKDLSIRMRQFFDHYLLDAPVPVWMSEGIPAVDKGKRTGYELEQNK